MKKPMYGKRLETLEDNRLVKTVARKEWKVKMEEGRVDLDGIGWQIMNLGWKLTLGHHKVRRQSGSGL